MKSLLIVLSSIFLLLYVPNALASCDIIDIIEMYDEDDKSKREIKRECDNTVSDAGSCSVYKVIRYYDKGYDEDEIAEECNEIKKIQVSNVCQTPTFWCRTQNRVAIGNSCICPSNWGPVSGRMVKSN